MAYTKYSLTPADNNAAPPNGAPEGMLPSAVNDTMRDMMSQIRDVGDGIRGGTYTMTAPVITGGSINGTTVGASTASTGRFSTLEATGVSTFSAGTVSAPAITTTGDTNTGIFFPAADTIAFTEGGVESMRLNSSGNLGLGTAAPSSNGAVKFIEISDATSSGVVLTAARKYSISSSSTSSLNFRDETASATRISVDSSGNVNIGAGTPDALLHVNNVSAKIRIGATSGSSFLDISRDNSTGFIFYNAAQASPFRAHIWQLGGSEAMRIDSAGNVGIGTSSPTTRLDVFGAGDVGRFDTTSAGGLVLSRVNAVGNGSSHFTLKFNNSDSTVAAIFTLNRTGGTTSTGTGYELRTVAEGTGYLTYFTNSAERMRIDSSGNVGIGTSSPDVRLEIRNASADVFSRANTANGFSAGYQMRSGDGIFQIASIPSTNGQGIAFTQIAVGERMRIDSSGNLLVGTTSAVGQLTLQNAYGGGVGISINTTNTGTAFTGILFRQGGTNVGTITVSASSTSYDTSSDYRLKENIAPMTGALGVVQQLKPVTYNWKINGSSGQGFIAHELAEVVPDCVTGEKDAVDKDGKPQYQGIDTSFLVATLTAAIQEQQALIQNLTTRLNALEGK